MRLSPEQRRQRVLERVRELGSVSMSELASEFGVSPVTIRVDVNELESRDQVRRTPEAVVPLGRAVPPANGSEETVLGMVLPNSDYYFADIISSARKTVAEHGARLVVATTHYQPEQDVAQAEKLLADGAHGLILVPSWPTGEPGPDEGGWIADLREQRVPVVLTERWVPLLHPLARLDRVCTDHVHGVALAVQRLAAHGHQRILLATQNNLYAQRLGAAYTTAVQAVGLAEHHIPPLVTRSELPERERREQLLAQLRTAISQHGVTAAIIHTGLDAVVMVPLLVANGIGVPADLAIIAYDDEVAELADVPLTSIATPKGAVGTTAAELLLRRIANPTATRHHAELLPELHVRDSA